MNKTIKRSGLALSVAVASLFVATSAFAYSVNGGGAAYGGGGLTTTVAGAVVTDFNTSLANPTGYSGGAVKNSSVPQQWAQPPADPSNFFSVGPSTSTPGIINLGINRLASYFGYYAGSPDPYNRLQLWRDNVLLEDFDGTELAAFIPVTANGDQSVGRYWNIWADSSAEYFNIVKFISVSNAFETDNHAVSYVPLPAALPLMLSGLGVLGFAARRRREAV